MPGAFAPHDAAFCGGRLTLTRPDAFSAAFMVEFD